VRLYLGVQCGCTWECSPAVPGSAVRLYLGVQSGCTWECSYARPGRDCETRAGPGCAHSAAGCGAALARSGSLVGPDPRDIAGRDQGLAGRNPGHCRANPPGLVGQNPRRQLTCFPTQRGRRPVVPQSVQPGSRSAPWMCFWYSRRIPNPTSTERNAADCAGRQSGGGRVGAQPRRSAGRGPQ